MCRLYQLNETTIKNILYFITHGINCIIFYIQIGLSSKELRPTRTDPFKGQRAIRTQLLEQDE